MCCDNLKMYLVGYLFYLKKVNFRCFSSKIIATKSTINKLRLYGDEASPPVRFVMMTAEKLKIPLEYHKIDLFGMENLSEDYKKINPLQKVPALAVGQTVINDSHAISLYLCRQISNQDLYPKDALIRAKIDQMLFFNSCNLFPIDSAIFSEYFAGVKSIDEQKKLQWYKSLDYLEIKLNQTGFLADKKIRLCDLCCGATVTSLELLVPTLDHYSNVKKWIKQLQKETCFEVNTRGLQRLNAFVKVIK